MPKDHLAELERGIHHLTGSVKELRLNSDLQELLVIIRKPGWTTPAELQFANGMVSALTAQIQVVNQLSAALLAGSGAVGQR